MNRNIIKQIPNMLSFLRIILIVPIVILYNIEGCHLWAVIVLALSCFTDFFDGKIARKYDAVSKFGRGLDGFADKLMQLAMILCLLGEYSQLTVLFAVLLIKEVGMGVIGLVYYKKTKEVHGARIYGKVSTVFIDTTLITLFLFKDLPDLIVWGMISVCLISSFFAAVMYSLMYKKSFNEIKTK
ncbi:MAG: CDP-alcohol phosphatidyltransferase family protein [Ruminococcaceae bacterium]|nr:CDP-alcohol phosphatidyltransferase family protein [Oscillospiraceae bacterium]